MLESPRMSISLSLSAATAHSLTLLRKHISPFGPGESRGSCPPVFPPKRASQLGRSSSRRFDASPLSPFVCLDLLGAPAGVGLAHVGGRLDGRDELEDGVADTDQADDGAGNDAEDAAAEEDGSDEDVDCFLRGNAGQRGEQIRREGVGEEEDAFKA